MALGTTALALAVVNSCWLMFFGVPPEVLADSSQKTVDRTPSDESAPQPQLEDKAGKDTRRTTGTEGKNAKGIVSRPSEPEGAQPKPAMPPSSNANNSEMAAKLDRVVDGVARLQQLLEERSGHAPIDEAIESGELVCRIGDAEYTFIYIPAGTFIFGYPAFEETRVVQATGNPNAFLNATPEALIKVTRGFFMLDREVTIRQWNACLTADGQGNSAAAGNPEDKGADVSDVPKRNITWGEASAFCRALEKAIPSATTHLVEVRLPTEIEWEYAARGSQSKLFPWVPDLNSPGKFLGTAKTNSQSPLPLDPQRNKDSSWRRQFDFAGNLCEWCLDRYDQDLHERLLKRLSGETVLQYDPWADEIVLNAKTTTQNESNPSRSLRGGAYSDPESSCELPIRRFLPQNKEANHIGLRPVIAIRRLANDAQGMEPQ